MGEGAGGEERDLSYGDVQSPDLEKFRVGSLPTIFYVPDFVTPHQEQYLLHQVHGAPTSKWKVLKNRRLQNWGGVVHDKGLIPQSLPSWLTSLTERIFKETRLFPAAINHVLVNEYLPGQGIMAHQDGPLYFPVVAILSLGSPTLMKFMPHSRFVTSTMETDSVLAESNSVRVYQDPSKQDVHKTNTETIFPQQLEEPNEANSLNSLSELASHASLQSLKEREQNSGNHLGTDLYQGKKNTESVALMPRSLLIFKDAAYQDFLHGIDECYEHFLDEKVVNMSSMSQKVDSCSTHDSDPLEMIRGCNFLEDQDKKFQSSCLRQTETRVSLTCRYVPKTFGRFIRL